MENNRELYNHLAEKYDLRQQNPATQLLRLKENGLIKKYSKGLVFDLGCGTGYHLGLSNQIIGLDISEKMLKKAKNKKRPLIQADIEWLPIKTRSLESVFCFYSALNMVDYQKAAKEMSRIVKSGGNIILSVASIKDADKSRSSQQTKIKKFRLEGKPVNIRLLEKNEVIQAFENSSFKLKSFGSIFRMQKPRWGNFQKFSPLEKIKLKIEKLFPKEWGKIYLFVFEKV